MNAESALAPPVLALPPDGRLHLTIAAELEPLVRGWLPANAPPVTIGAEALASICVAGGLRSALDTPEDPCPPIIRLGPVRAYAPDNTNAAVIRLAGAHPDVLEADLDLAIGRADYRVKADDPRTEAYLRDALTIGAALLFGRHGHTLIHAAAVRAAGGFWLIVGDARSGKSSTTAALVEAGHDWLSDDQVVLSADSGGRAGIVHGWPREVHLDRGWGEHRPSGERVAVEAAALGPGTLVECGPVAGVLVPEIRPESDSTLEQMRSSEALGALVRQSPWLMADPGMAPELLRLLEAIARLPSFRLVLGAGSFGNGSLLSSLLRDAAPRG